MGGSLPQSFLEGVFEFLRSNENSFTKESLVKEKQRLAKEHGIVNVPSDICILTHLDGNELEYAKPYLLSKPSRSGSGVTVVAVMTRPKRCPHGRCTYCPGGPSSLFGDTPQSYTGHEPAALRGARANFDAYVQVFNRLEQYLVSGHDPQKVELIIMGGTFPAEDVGYQDAFVRDCYQALNDFSRLFYDEEGVLRLERFKEFFLLPGSVHDETRVVKVQEAVVQVKAGREQTLEESQQENESARLRCVGTTIETRPERDLLPVANNLLRLGVTRVELGVQTTFDDVLEKVHRGHTVQDSIDSISVLRDLGLKVNAHLMLGLPLMTRERDVEAVKRLFTDPGFKPDMLKIYPCMVLPGTPLYDDYKNGSYTPLSTNEAASLIAEMKQFVPRWVRIMRVQRDIPSNLVAAGVDKTNLRQVVGERLAALRTRCSCIRCREIKNREAKKAVLNVLAYEANGGEEFFISIDDPTQDALIGFCRLRFPGKQLRPEFDVRTAIVRELHVYGKATGLGVVGVPSSSQHKGYGSQLLHVAERISREHGKRKLLVISGVGVRQYYEKLGYKREGPYMGKEV